MCTPIFAGSLRRGLVLCAVFLVAWNSRLTDIKLVAPMAAEDRLAQLRKHTAKLAEATDLLQVCDKFFHRYVFYPDERPYHVVLLLTTPNNCSTCAMLREALGTVKQAAAGMPGEPTLFFAELSHEKGKLSFLRMGITHAPVLLYVPHQADGEKASATQYTSYSALLDLFRKSDTAIPLAQYPLSSMEHLNPEMEAQWIAQWIAQQSGLPVSMPQPLWKNPVVLNVILALLFIVLTVWVPHLKRAWLRLPLFAVCIGGMATCVWQVWLLFIKV